MSGLSHAATVSLPEPVRLAELALDAIGEMVSVLGDDGIYRHVNRAWCEATGQAADTVVGRRAIEIFPNLAGLEDGQCVRRCLTSGEPLTLRGTLPLPRVAGHAFEATYTPYGRDQAGVPCVVVVTRDVTEWERQRTALAASNLDLERTLNTISEGIFASDSPDLDAPLRFVNHRLLEMLGIPDSMRATLTMRQVLAFSAPLFVDADLEFSRIRRIVENDLSQVDRLTLRDGRTLLRRCVSTADEFGPLRVWSVRDISTETQAQQRLEIAQAKTRQLLDAFPGLIAELDDQLRYTFVNEAFLRVLGSPRDAVIGHSIADVVGSERGAEVRGLAARALAGENVVFERWQGGRCIQVSMVGAIDRESGRAQYQGFGFDITGLKQAQEALIAARDDAERANRAKSKFLSNMSHELRTPLNAILGFAQVLRDDSALVSSKRAQAEEILRGARHLHRLINDALDLASVEAGKLPMDIGAVALLVLAQECVRLLEPLAAQRGVALLPVDPRALDHTVSGDALRLRQVLLNLLGNAIKYNRPGGRVALDAQRRASRLRIGVTDDGPGLTAEQMARLFIPFERPHAMTPGVEGTGIGLALSRHLVRGMGGEIGVESEPGSGSHFWFELPLCDAPAAGPVSAALPLADARPAHAKRHNVLYIEDNSVNIVLMEAMLMRVPGVVMHSEALPGAGIERAFTLRPDLILLDIQLPGMSGFEVLERLRADVRTRDIPVIAVSANAMPEDVAAGGAAGFLDYLSKPLELPTLIAAVQRALAEHPMAAA